MAGLDLAAAADFFVDFWAELRFGGWQPLVMTVLQVWWVSMIVLFGLFLIELYVPEREPKRPAMEKSTFTREYEILRTLIREYREAAGLTQVELAERIGETQSYVSKVERGERRLDLVQLRVFCEAMKVPLSTFVARFERSAER